VQKPYDIDITQGTRAETVARAVEVALEVRRTTRVWVKTFDGPENYVAVIGSDTVAGHEQSCAIIRCAALDMDSYEGAMELRQDIIRAIEASS
jgi:hypothetical protein